MNWEIQALNTDVIRDYCNLAYSHFSDNGKI